MADEVTVVEAHAFILKDKDGKTRGSFGTNQNGEPLLTIADEDGRARVALGYTKQKECRFIMFDDEGNVRINIGFLPTGQGAIMCMGKPGHPSAGIRMGYEEGFGFVAFGGSGKVREAIGVTSQGDPHLVVLDPDGQPIFNAVKPTGEGMSEGGIVIPRPPKLPPVPKLPPEISE